MSCKTTINYFKNIQYNNNKNKTNKFEISTINREHNLLIKNIIFNYNIKTEPNTALVT